MSRHYAVVRHRISHLFVGSISDGQQRRQPKRTGVVSDTVGEQLRAETNLKLDQVAAGEFTALAEQERYDEFWPERVRELGLAVDDARRWLRYLLLITGLIRVIGDGIGKEPVRLVVTQEVIVFEHLRDHPAEGIEFGVDIAHDLGVDSVTSRLRERRRSVADFVRCCVPVEVELIDQLVLEDYLEVGRG